MTLLRELRPSNISPPRFRQFSLTVYCDKSKAAVDKDRHTSHIRDHARRQVSHLRIKPLVMGLCDSDMEAPPDFVVVSFIHIAYSCH